MSAVCKLLFCLITLGGFLPMPSPCQGQARDWVEQFSADEKSLKFKYRIHLSPLREARLTEFYAKWIKKLSEVDFNSLDRDQKVDTVLLNNHIRLQARKLQENTELDSIVKQIIPFWKPLIEILQEHESLKKLDGKAVAQSLADVTLAIQKDQTRYKLFMDSRPNLVYRTTLRMEEILRSLDEMNRFYDEYDPIYTWWVAKPYAELTKEMKACLESLQVSLKGDAISLTEKIIGQPIGAKALDAELQSAMIPYNSRELIDLAERELTWCDNEMIVASKALGFTDWRDAQNFVKAKHVEPGQQPEMIADLAREAIQFLEVHQLITLPAIAKESWRMKMMSPARQKMSPYFLGGNTIIVSFPTDTMSHADKLMSMRGNNIHFARATVHHELIPGHHLQYFMNDRNKPYRKIFSTPFWLEGWAVYWETLLWDMDFARSPEDRIGMLFWRKHRCARIIFSLGYHAGEMTPEECIDLLIDRVGHERNNATAEVRRSIMGGYGPLYQAGYMLGALQFRKLHEELVQSGKMTNREFHDAVLKENYMPIEILRARLLELDLELNYKPNWRFYDETATPSKGQ
jgi:uncharacterized protein (DUF885 family)